MRILLLNTFPAWGGDEKWTLNVALGLHDRGHQVVVSSPPDTELTGRAQAIGLSVFPFTVGPDIAFWRIRPFVRYLKKHAIEAAIFVQNRDVKIGAFAARLAGVPAIFARAGLDTMKKRLYHKIAFTRYIDGIIANTKSLKALYDGYGWFEDGFIQVVYDGLDIPRSFNKIDPHRTFALNDDSRIIMGAGRLVAQKRFDLLVEVAAIAKSRGYNWRFVIAGAGELLPKLLQQARALGVEEMVRFIGFRNDVMDLLHAADVFVLSSDSEGMSNALREAMAVGTACVATDVFGVEELFRDGQYGIRVPKGDARAIFNAVETILADEELKRKLERKAADLIRSEFTMKKMLDDVERILLNTVTANTDKLDKHIELH